MSTRVLPQRLRDQISFNADGLVPAIAQEAESREVLMMAWMNEEALAATLSSGRATYWSRSRQEIWVKGLTSGHVQEVVSLSLDCDGDTVLVQVRQTGVACHTGTPTCFSDREIELTAQESR